MKFLEKSTGLNKQPNQQLEASFNRSDGFNFDLWAKEVKPLLIAALQKRAKHSDN